MTPSRLSSGEKRAALLVIEAHGPPVKLRHPAKGRSIQLYGTLPRSITAIIEDPSITTQADQVFDLNIPIHLIQLLNEGAHLAVCDSPTDFLLRQREFVSDGWPIETIFGSNVIDLDAVFGTQNLRTQPATVSQWVGITLQPFDVLGVPERLGLTLLASLVMRVRWHLIESKFYATNSS